MKINKDFLRQSVIGENWPVNTPFGVKPLVYADHTASGRSLKFIEQFIQDKVMPYYGNTHTETSLTGRQTTFLREQSRRIIRQSLKADSNYHVIFTGSGATSAINRFIHLLNFDQYTACKPVVFIGGYEHHSNDLPWREANATLIRVGFDKDGALDIAELEQQLENYKDAPLLVGSFSAASNVTGIKTDVERVNSLLKSYGALSCWDYAAAAPYVAINLEKTQMDAVFISPHKFLGGPGTPGLLVVKQGSFRQALPGVNGGGTVAYVNADQHHYVENIERREEGGTPAIIESIRAGLVFKIQQQIGLEYIEQCEEALVEKAFVAWGNQENLEILGSSYLARLPIFSFNIKNLHYGLVVAMLNDLFGIQARGGCSCAGPYAHHLLNIPSSQTGDILESINAGKILSRPGWVRLNLHYLFDNPTVEYILKAVALIADKGHLLAPLYDYDESKGVWHYRHHQLQMNLSLDNWDNCFGDVIEEPETLNEAMQHAVHLFEQLAHNTHAQSDVAKRDKTPDTSAMY